MNINSNRLMNSKYKDKIAYFINNTDLNAYFPNYKIVKFAELDNYASIYELLPNKLDFAFNSLTKISIELLAIKTMSLRMRIIIWANVIYI